MKKYLQHLLELADLRLFVVRYGVNVLLLLEIICLPILLNPKFYNEIEFLRYAFLMGPVVLLGSNSGYIYLFYKSGINFTTALLIFSALVAFLFSIILFYVFDDLLVSLAFWLFVLVVSIEKVLITLNRLAFASLYKSFTSLIVLILSCLIFFEYMQIKSSTVYLLGLIIGQFIWISIYVIFWCDISFARLKIDMTSVFLDQVCLLIKKGFLLNVQTYILLGYFLFDRYIINTFFHEYSSGYSIAFSLSQVVIVAMNTISFSAQQKIGQSISDYSLLQYNKSLKTTFILFIILSSLSLFAVYAFSFLLPEYGNFYYSYAIITFFVGGYYLFSAFAIIAFYKDLNFVALAIIFSFTALNISLTYLMVYMGSDYYANLTKSCILIFLSGFVLDQFIRRKLK